MVDLTKYDVFPNDLNTYPNYNKEQQLLENIIKTTDELNKIRDEFDSLMDIDIMNLDQFGEA